MLLPSSFISMIVQNVTSLGSWTASASVSQWKKEQIEKCPRRELNINWRVGAFPQFSVTLYITLHVVIAYFDERWEMWLVKLEIYVTFEY